MNPAFDTIGKSFVKEYYRHFDTKQTRGDCVKFYLPTNCLLTFEEEQCMGQEAIYNKITEKLPMGNISRAVTKVDCQPMVDGGVLVHVLGQLKTLDSDGDKPMAFTQVFVLKPEGQAFYIANEIFRLALHDFAAQQ